MANAFQHQQAAILKLGLQVMGGGWLNCGIAVSPDEQCRNVGNGGNCGLQVPHISLPGTNHAQPVLECTASTHSIKVAFQCSGVDAPRVAKKPPEEELL